jgi:hypothetical protein
VGGKLAGVIDSIGGLGWTGQSAQFGFNTQMSQLAGAYLNIIRVTGTQRVGDFDDDGRVKASDIDILSAYVRAGKRYEQDMGAYLSGAVEFTDERIPEELIRRADVDTLVFSLVDCYDSGGNFVENGTHYGDANLDGFIDNADKAALLSHIGSSGGWADGDLNGDGAIDALDRAILFSNPGPNRTRSRQQL